MCPSTLVEMDWLFTSMSAHSLRRAATSIRVWQEAMQTPVLRQRELLEDEKYALHDVDVNVIREPFSFTAIDSSSAYRDNVVAPAGIGAQTVDEPAASPAGRIARVKACSSLPEIWRSDYGTGQEPVPAQPASRASSSSDVETGRQGPSPSLLRAHTILNNSVQLLVILQRYAKRLTHLPPTRKPPSTSKDRRVSPNVTMNVENVTASSAQRKKVTALLVKEGTIGKKRNIESSGNAGRSPTFSQPTTLDRFGLRAMRKLESWLDEVKTSDAPKLKIESARSSIVNSVVARAGTRKEILSALERLNDEARLDERAAVNQSRLALVPRTKNSRTRSLNNLRHSHDSNDVRDEFLPTRTRIADVLDQSVGVRTGARVTARRYQSRMAEVLQTADSKSMKLGNGRLLEQPTMIIQTLERIAEKLANIETKYVEIAAQAAQHAEAEGKEGSVEWLNDDDLTARLQRILKRQARRRGIDLS
jgi:hypothetical protein